MIEDVGNQTNKTIGDKPIETKGATADLMTRQGNIRFITIKVSKAVQEASLHTAIIKKIY